MLNRKFVIKVIGLAAAVAVLFPWLLTLSGHDSPFRTAPLKPSPLSFYTPVLSDFDGDYKLDTAELSSNGSFKQISVSLGSSTWKSLFFDSGVLDRGQLLSGDLDRDGDGDLAWFSTGDPRRLVLWLGDGRGNFFMASPSDPILQRMRESMGGGSGAGLADEANHGDIVLVPLTWSFTGLPEAVSSPRIFRPEGFLSPTPVPAIAAPVRSVIRKRGPPSLFS